MKVDFVDEIGDESGIGAYSTKLFHALKDLDVEIEAKEPHLSLPFLESTFQNFIEVPLIVFRSSADVVHLPSQEKASGLWFFPKRFLSNVVVTVHDISPYVNDYAGPVSQLVSWFYCRALRKIPKIIAISEFTKSELVEHLDIPEDKIEVVYQGVDKEYFYPREKNKEILEKYGVKQPYLLYVGSEIDRKNMKGVLEKFKEVREDQELNLVKVGDAGRRKYRKKTLGYMEELGLEKGEDVIFTGFVDEEDLPQIYSSAEATILWSHYEGFGRSVAESLACGTSVVIPNQRPMNDYVPENMRHPQNYGGYIIQTWDETSSKILDTYKKVI